MKDWYKEIINTDDDGYTLDMLMTERATVTDCCALRELVTSDEIKVMIVAYEDNYTDFDGNSTC
jgi:hypothetical protein